MAGESAAFPLGLGEVGHHKTLGRLAGRRYKGDGDACSGSEKLPRLRFRLYGRSMLRPYGEAAWEQTATAKGHRQERVEHGIWEYNRRGINAGKMPAKEFRREW